jgi:transcriptional regulator with XRE-family HTH domain
MVDAPWDAFGRHLRTQRQLAQLSLRQLAEMTRVSNPYLSQIERGLHQPSIAIVRALAEALDLSVEQMLIQAAGINAEDADPPRTDEAIRNDDRLTDGQKSALLAVYRSMAGDDPA